MCSKYFGIESAERQGCAGSVGGSVGIEGPSNLLFFLKALDLSLERGYAEDLFIYKRLCLRIVESIIEKEYNNLKAII